MKKIFLLLVLFSLMPVALLAQGAKPTEYQLLAPIPLNGPDNGVSQTTNASTFIPGLFKLIIGIATALAVVMIMYGGIQYISSGAFEAKVDAKKTIENALWGLLLAMGAWLILYTVNPQLVNFNLNITPQEIKTTPTAGTNLNTPSSTGPGNLALTQSQVYGQLAGTSVNIFGAIKLDGVRQTVIDEVIRLSKACGGCEVTITSATGGTHAETGTCNHINGYKVDLRSVERGVPLTNYITSTYKKLPDRGDGAKMYEAPSGALYAQETNPPHWDVAKCN